MEADQVVAKLEGLKKELLSKNNKNIIAMKNELYSQIESLLWLQGRIKLNGPLPPLRGWPVSPDFLLRLHVWLLKHKPKIVVETGSGATTLVIADALRQNGFGKLYSFEHLNKYASQTKEMLDDECLSSWVELRVGDLEPWYGEHLNSVNNQEPTYWYPLKMDGIENIDLLIVDGPPGGTCKYARYPAVPALFDRLAHSAEIWMDDADRKDEQDICHYWAEKYELNLEFFPLDKGLAIMSRNTVLLK